MIFFMTALCGRTQSDSIRQVLNKMPDDTAKVKLLNNLCWDFRNKAPENSVVYGKEAIQLAKKTGFTDEMLKAMSFTGVAYRNLGNYPEAFKYFFEHLEESKKFNNLEQQGYAYINIGNAYIYQEKPIEAIKMLDEALKITKKLKNDKQSAYVMLNLGRAYLLNDDFIQANYYFMEAYDFRKNIEDKDGQGICLKYIGDTYFEKGELDKALDMYIRSMELVELEKDQDLYSDILDKVANVYLQKGNNSEALKNALKSYSIGLLAGTKLRTKNACLTISKTYEKLHDFNNAYKYQTLFIIYKDSLFNEDVGNRIADIEYERERQIKQKEYELERQKKQSEINLLIEQEETHRAINIGLVSGLSLILLLALVLFRSNRVRKKTNRLLTKQNELIEKKNTDLEVAYTEIQLRNEEITTQKEEITAQRDFVMKQGDKISRQKDLLKEQRDFVLKQKKEITDSIHYAKRIQNAILPPIESMKDYLNDYFIFFHPRDIVSGDFYWTTEIQNKLVIAAADCTGHGVPGAFMSMLGIASMNEIVNKMDNISAAGILNNLRDNIIKSLHQTGKEGESKDGMDIALCVVDKINNELHFAGANNPLYLIRNGELIEFKGDKMPIGIQLSLEYEPFKNNMIKLETNDVFYMFSDGFADQFGGPKGGKFKYKPLKELLLSTHLLPMNEQKEVLHNKLEEWMNFNDPQTNKPFPQIDDIVVVGCKF